MIRQSEDGEVASLRIDRSQGLSAALRVEPERDRSAHDDGRVRHPQDRLEAQAEPTHLVTALRAEISLTDRFQTLATERCTFVGAVKDAIVQDNLDTTAGFASPQSI